MTIQPGDLVQLRSGGPAMVAANEETSPLTGEAGWLCFWSIQGAARRESFPGVVLRPYEPGTVKGARSA
jgi:uncharacterized protein YodC (DUF2158 family)